MAKVDVWIATAITGSERILDLSNAVESALNLSPVNRVVISLSYDEKTNLSLLIRHPRVLILPLRVAKNHKHPRQFDHLRNIFSYYIINGLEISPTDWVTFLDDDDLLLQSIVEYYKDKTLGHSFLANQYITIIENADKSHTIIDDIVENVTANNVEKMVAKYAKLMLVSADFSGTTVRWEKLKIYFTEEPQPEPEVAMLEDIHFMKWIESIGGEETKEPIALHRVRGGSSLWKEDVVDSMLSMLTKISELKKDTELLRKQKATAESVDEKDIHPAPTASMSLIQPEQQAIEATPGRFGGVASIIMKDISKYLGNKLPLPHSLNIADPSNAFDWILTFNIECDDVMIDKVIFHLHYPSDYPFKHPVIKCEHKDYRWISARVANIPDYCPADRTASIIALLYCNILDYLSTGTCDLIKCKN